ncbi:period circadian protein isoform X3 [Bombyx mandarina]|uniref:Period circadian protein n=1 Tax=Bombyx mandarina TaxID=7092 RepID=A0A6J2K5A6_BOMMA|nr:period circadian protein isoform X3 [Bombyx mandarina]
MDNLENSENTDKISDSAYSNSCSYSQSRRSHSSKSTHSGSYSSGSSGYGGRHVTGTNSNKLAQSPNKDKELKKKKQSQTELTTTKEQNEGESGPQESVNLETLEEEKHDVTSAPSPAHVQVEKGPENMDIASTDTEGDKVEVLSCDLQPQNSTVDVVTSRSNLICYTDGFSCVISMHDGIVMYTTSSLTATLGFPKDMWIGRSFIDFVHPRDRSTFASQITSGLAVPKTANGTQEKAQSPGNSGSTMVCRIRRYRGLSTGFGVKERVVTFMPFLLKFTFKNISDEEGNVIYLVIQATPFFSAFKTSFEILPKVNPFVMRHSANGNLEYLDPESVPYLGYLPQDVQDKDALQLYHPEDLEYLQQVYEVIVKDGGMPRSKTYRMMTQNGDYIKIETEWSSFINPWSKKLEFVIGKHYIIEGPENPDVFQSQDPEKHTKLCDEQIKKSMVFRENIVKLMNEALTKPAEVAKQQMSKRCQDLASFMESLMEEPPKNDEELRLEIQDPDHSYYERDSVMLGGISPHHDYNDSKSSTETPLSYNQLNYNETLQRYFDSHEPFSSENFNPLIVAKEPNNLKSILSTCLSPMAQNSGDSTELNSSSDSSSMALGGVSPVGILGDYHHVRLTEFLLTKHNDEMEKELINMHRESRSNSKGERDKTSNETRQKKKEHLARCKASFHPTATSTTPVDKEVYKKPHGVKRASKHIETETVSHKYHCPSPRASRPRQTTSAAPVQTSSTLTTSVASTTWPPSTNAAGNMNTFILGVGMAPQMSLISPVPPMAGMLPLYYTPMATMAPVPSTSEAANHQNLHNNPQQYAPPPMQCVLYGQPIYGQPMYSSPFVYSPMNPHTNYPMQQTTPQPNAQFTPTNTMNPLCLANSNYEEKKNRSPLEILARLERTIYDGEFSRSLNNLATFCRVLSVDRSCVVARTEAGHATTPSKDIKKTSRLGNTEEVVDKTDGESSYSSFYSSFFKTESGSAEESGESKKRDTRNHVKFWDKNYRGDDGMAMPGSTEVRQTFSDHHIPAKVPRRNIEPPWMEQVCLTSELVYNYQIRTKTMEEVLSSDKQKISNLEQPSLVNEQLGQLYLDLQLEGVAARLTLEEGITSSSSSGEETTTSSKRKREYSKLVMIYEENAPFPPPPSEEIQEIPTANQSES